MANRARAVDLGGGQRVADPRPDLAARAAAPRQEEILLRLRELQSDYEYGFSISLTYTFGSIFSSIVNPRFGQ